MNLKETLLRGIYAYGFEKPSAIQQRAIIPCIKGMESQYCQCNGMHVLSEMMLSSFGTDSEMETDSLLLITQQLVNKMVA